MRTLVLVAAVLLVGALGVFLVRARFKNPFKGHDIPKQLGIGIQYEGNGVTYTQAHGGHTLFKIHASKVVQLKDNLAMLHNVKIELYGEDGARVDRIEGDEFEYDQKNQKASAAGPVEITLMRPGATLAIAPNAKPAQVVNGKSVTKPLATAAEVAERGEIHVKTSGLVFDQKSGLVTTSERVDFSMNQGSGSSIGASYDSQEGFLVLNRSVELTSQRGGEVVRVHAAHADFNRNDEICNLRDATADYRGGNAIAAEAKILFRDDGSVEHLDANGGFRTTTATGGHLAAPTGSMDFDAHNQPRYGHMEGGVQMDSQTDARTLRGSAPTAELEFTTEGQLRHAHLERGVEMRSDEETPASGSRPGSGPAHVTRTWHSPVADVEFRQVGKGQVEPAQVHGTGGVVVTGETQRANAAPTPSRLAADEVTGSFGPGSVLTAMTGVGHASIEETTATGTRQTSAGDRLEAHFTPAKAGEKNAAAGGSGVQSAVLEGHVVLTQEPQPKPGAQQATMKATAGKAVYEGTGEWLHLTVNPRVEDGQMQMTADKVDVSQESGDAFAHGNVKATWMDARSAANGKPVNNSSKAETGNEALGGSGPAHVIAAEGQLYRTTGEATFTGHARLWQQTNWVSAPVIILNRDRRTLVARSTDINEPVRTVLVSAGGLTGNSDASGKAGNRSAPSVIRVRGGDLRYSDVERKAVMRAGAMGVVTAESGTASSTSNEVELTLLPPGNRPGPDAAQGQVDKMIATGHVVVTSEGRRGTGEQLLYTSQTGEYVLTGTATAAPKMTDSARGTVTGKALIFHSRDDSVSIEGGGEKTQTETTAPK
jgi:lipopolysaccharide export system protein LptA